MKKKLIAFALCSTLLTACASPKYKISDQNVKNWIGIANDIEQCINPNLTNSAAYSLISKEESSLLQNYGQEALAQIIGVQKYRIMTSDPKSWDYFDKKFIEFNNNVKANLLTSSQCEAYKIKFFNELAVMKQQQHQQRIDKAKADEFRAWYVGQMMSQDLKSRGNQHRVIIQHR